MKKMRGMAILNMVALLIQLAVTWMVQSRLINDKDVGEVSDRHPTLFTPAGSTFAIWGLIYFLLLAQCLYHLVVAWRDTSTHPGNQDLEQMGSLFIVNNLAAAAWLYVWTHEWLQASVVLILIQLIALIVMNLRLEVYDRHASMPSKLFTQLPLSIYLGWICMATIANANTWLATTTWDRMGLSAVSWTIGLIGLAVLIAALGVLGRKNVFFGLVVIWALNGIVVKRMRAGGPDTNIILAARIGMIVVGAICLIQLAGNLSRKGAHRRHALFPLAPHSSK